MESEEFNRYKILCAKNKKMLESVSQHICNSPQFLSHDIYNYAQIKQQYEIMLAASKDSIDYNSQLQMELQLKQETLRSLKGKLSKQNRELEGLVNEISRATGQLKRQKRSCRDLLRSEEEVDKLRNDVMRLKRKKSQLIREQSSFKQKQQEIKKGIKKLEEGMAEMQSMNQKQGVLLIRKIGQLQNQIKQKKQQMIYMKQIGSGRASTPDHHAQKRKSFAEIQLMIRQQKQKEMI